MPWLAILIDSFCHIIISSYAHYFLEFSFNYKHILSSYLLIYKYLYSVEPKKANISNYLVVTYNAKEKKENNVVAQGLQKKKEEAQKLQEKRGSL